MVEYVIIRVESVIIRVESGSISVEYVSIRWNMSYHGGISHI